MTAAKKNAKKYPQEMVDFAMETADYFQYDDNGTCINRYEVIEEMYAFARNDLGYRISIDDFADLVDSVAR